MNRRLLMLGAVLAFAAASAGLHAGDARAQSKVEAEEFGGPFSLLDQDGKRRTDKDFRGRYMLVFFGYTYCPDACPTALAVQAQALEELGPLASRIAPVFVTVDPRRDGPERLKAYLSAFDARPPTARLKFTGLTGSDDEISAVAKAYRVIYQAHMGGHPGNVMEYTVDHTTDIYLLDPEGKFAAYYTLGISPPELAADLKSRLGAR
jgi:cytochrome oxidase Cu insertion factor (SCO1/SenC/PrrC family)